MTPPEYILDRRYQTMLLAVRDLTWDAPKVLLPDEIKDFLDDYPADETYCISHNALFDLAILAWRYSWVPRRLGDTLGMVRALRNYRNNSLKEVMKQLFGRDTKGDVIHKVIGMDASAIKRAGLWPTFKTYAMQDVTDCMHIFLKLYPEFPVEEQLVMDLVLRACIEPRLVADKTMLEDHLRDLRRKKTALLRDCGYDKAAVMSTIAFQEALERLGVEIQTKPGTRGPIPQFAKSDKFMSDLLEYDRSYDDDVNYQVQTLAAARLSEKSTIEETRAEKFVAVANAMPAFPVPLRYGGAHTHRLSGEWKMNCQNLPRDVDRSRLRASLIAPPGHLLVTADEAQIEARIVACLAGQAKLIEQFRDGEDVYARFASTIFGCYVTKDTHPRERFIGKTAVLGLGYGCGWQRFHNMVVTDARKYGIPLEGLFDEAKAEETVNTYRLTFYRIAAAWRKLDWLLKNYLTGYGGRRAWGPVAFEHARIVLPNRMTLRYTLPDDALYGAKLLENITQALARIVVMSAAVRLWQRHGLRFVLQTHDELVFVIKDCDILDSARLIRQEMTVAPSWMPNLPLAVEVKTGANYGSCRKLEI